MTLINFCFEIVVALLVRNDAERAQAARLPLVLLVSFRDCDVNQYTEHVAFGGLRSLTWLA